jgi:hypothetical protein
LPAVSVPAHAGILERLDTIGYKRGSHTMQVSWFSTDDSVFSEANEHHWETLGSSRGAPRKVHCISLARARPADDLVQEIASLTAKAYAA